MYCEGNLDSANKLKKKMWRYNDARWRHWVNHVIHRNFWRLIFAIMSPKFGIKRNTQVKTTAKYGKHSWRERGYFIGDIISPSGVNKIRLIKPKQALNMSMHHPSLSLLLFFLFTFPCRGGSLHSFNLWRVRQHFTKQARWNNRDKE